MDDSIYMLIAARLHGEVLSDEEARRLDGWLEAPAHRELFRRYEALFEARARLRARDRARLPRGFARRATGGVWMGRWSRWTRVAGVFLLLATAAAALWGVFDSEKVVAVDVAPGSSRAVLRLADGRAVSLGDTGALVASGAVFPGGSAGTLSYGSGEGESPAEEHWLEVRRGGEYKVELPDGSRVWLNSESTLAYPSRFAGGERVVRLEGEAYFEVVEDAGAPFSVLVGGCTVRVLGTRFNACHYAGDRQAVTTLLSGAVEVSAGGAVARLRPGQQCAYDAVDGVMTTREVDAERYASWTRGLFAFDAITVEELGRQMARWYDVEVRFADDAVRGATFTGSMERYRPASYIARLLNETNTVWCSMDNDRVLTFRAPR
ncbi:MAG: FecR domain-containing protein [Odoribacteraceae bacterium]|jgi:ferric-dicitrate binding protein FerR (iron transport regulator)|nr:FecR domain-containing protein [Odoribacteraceae bacterium]